MKSGWRHFGATGAILALVALVAGCSSGASGSSGHSSSSGSPSSGSASGSLVYGRWGSAYEIKAGKVLLTAFEKTYPHVTVHQQVADWNTYWTKLPTQLAAGTAPDVFLLDPGYYQDHYAGTGRIMSLDHLIQQSHINMGQYWAQELPTFKYQGHYYELPRDISLNTLLWNKTLFRKAGLTKAPSSWQELLHDAQLLTIDKNGRNATQAGFDPSTIVQWGYGNYEYLDGIDEPLMTEMGGHLWSQPETSGHVKSLIDSPAGQKAIQYLVDLTYKYHVSPTPTQLGHYQNVFAAGKVAMYIDGTFDLPEYYPIKSFAWDMAPFPSWNGVEASMSQGVGNVINASASNKQAAWDLVKWLGTTPGQKVMSANGINIPSIRSLAESPAFLKGQPSGMRSVIATIKYGVPYLDFPHKADAFNYVDTVLNNDVFSGHMTVPAGLAKAQSGANTILSGGHV